MDELLMKNPTSIATFQSASAARMVVRRLRDAGFEVAARSAGTSDAPLDTGTSGVFIHRVVVPFVEAARALSWCREFDAAEGLLSHAIRCPKCGSLRVELATGDPVEASASAVKFVCAACRAPWSVTLYVGAQAKEEHAAA
jgi:hypothetical protein